MDDIKLLDLAGNKLTSRKALKRLDIYGDRSTTSIRNLAKTITSRTPGLSSYRVIESSSPYFDEGKGIIGLAHAPEHDIAKQLNRAERHQLATGTGRAMLRLSKGISRAAGFMAVPMSLLVAKSDSLTPDQKVNVLRGLSAATAVTSIPYLVDDLSSSYGAVSDSSDKLEALQEIAPSTAINVLKNVIAAPLTFLGASRLLNQGHQDMKGYGYDY
jgi:hypothetical protein